jgi:hypothetical protein
MRGAVLVTLLLACLLVLAAPAVAQVSPVEGANVLSATSVRLTFGAPLTPTEAEALTIGVRPSLAIGSRTLTDNGYGLVLQTGPQANAIYYTAAVTGPTGADLGSALFIGTNLGATTTAGGQDDFNRRSGLVPTDAPITGPWHSTRIDTGNTAGLVTAPSLLGGPGDRAFFSQVLNRDPEQDNASLFYRISGTEYYVSAYVYIPSGQDWAPGQSVGLMRLNQYYYTAHARLSAFAETSSSYSLRVDWKSTGNVYFSRLAAQGGVEPLVASGLAFDRWYWLQLHVKNSPSTGAPGIVEAWVDGQLAYQQTGQYVHTTPMTYAEFGIMHLVTTGPGATTFTDQVRLGTTPQLPSLGVQPPPDPDPTPDTTPPSVTLTSPLQNAQVGAGFGLQASASDDRGVERVDFLVDGTVVASDATAPYEAVVNGAPEGPHTVAASAVDTSGNVAQSAPVTITVVPPAPAPTIALVSLAPQPWSPAAGPLTITYATNVAGTLTVRFTPATKQSLLGSVTIPVQAGQSTVQWNGVRNRGFIAPGQYAARAFFTDTSGRAATPSPLVTTFTVVR